MTMTLFLVRHGSHDRLGRILCGRMEGVVLSPHGEAEAQAAAHRLGRRSLAAVYSSPLQRTLQTAAPLAEARGVPVETDDDLCEVDVGDWTGLSFQDLAGRPEWRLWNEARSTTRPPRGETIGEVAARAARFIDRARARHPQGEVAAVTHSDVIKAALCQLLGLSFDRHDRLEVSPGSITTVIVGDWGAKLHQMNEVVAWAA